MLTAQVLTKSLCTCWAQRFYWVEVFSPRCMSIQNLRTWLYLKMSLSMSSSEDKVKLNWVGPNPMAGVLTRRGKFEHLHGEHSHVNMETEIKVLLPKAKEYKQLPATTWRYENEVEQVLPQRLQKATYTANTWFHTSSIQNSERINFFCFRPQRLW